ncbi:MAG: T9SS type A sorting domain-containing protein [Bacteroidetes bacterium]|jgi:hypothetical protein|nr:T9SS type A sorting domain-containing protein [Bacteroidota bacterium]
MKNRILPLFLLAFVTLFTFNAKAQITYVDLNVNQQNIEDCLTSVNNHSINNGLSIYPNPTEGIFTIDFANIIESGKVTIVLHNMRGQEVYKEIMNLSNKNNTQISLVGQPAGIYVLRVLTDKRFFTAELIIK